MQRYTTDLFLHNALHVSGGSSANHQELITVHTASGICQTFTDTCRYRRWVGVSSNSSTI